LLQVRVLRSDGTSTYNGLNATFRHHGKGGIDFYSGFNFSKCIDTGTSPASTSTVTVNGNNPGLRRGLCDFDQNLTWRSTLVWTSPSLQSSGKMLRGIAGAWMVSALVIADAGMPFSVSDNADFSYTGNSLDLADRVPGKPAYVNGKLNYAAFTHNAPGTYGNSGRNVFRGPAYFTVDPALMKLFPIAGERTKLMVRAEAFNILNHPNLAPPLSNYNSTADTFGTITVARDPRILQFSLKLLF
jgi:hypothetical protein